MDREEGVLDLQQKRKVLSEAYSPRVAIDTH